MFFNYHTHTPRCKHAVGDEREYVETAILGGIKTLGFSDHAPYLFKNTDYYSGFRMGVDELHAYAEKIRALAKEYEKDIRLLCGFELEYYPAFHNVEMEFLKQIHPDYLIMGQHFFGNEIDAPSATCIQDEATFSAYITQILEGLKTGDFLYLAHPDLAGYNFSPDVIQREYGRLCQGAKAMHIPLEINFLGLRDNRHYPKRTLFEIAARTGTDVIFGADAHEPKNVCDIESEKVARTWVKELKLHLIETPLL